MVKSNNIRISGNSIIFNDGLEVGFQRTLRIPDDGKNYPLPPGLGHFPIRRVEDYQDKVPSSWLSRGGVFIPMYQSEALWINFSGDYPCAVKIAAGKITDEEVAHLDMLDARIDDAIDRGDVEAYLEGNFRFHFALYDIAQTPILRKIATSLWLQFGPSHRVVSGRYGTSNLPDKHSEALEALRQRDPEATAVAIREDIEQGLQLMTQALNA